MDGRLALIGILVTAAACGDPITSETARMTELPPPDTTGPFEAVLAARRSVRDYTSEPLALEDISQLVWAAQGITEPGGRGRAAPSAGGLYPIELYVATDEGLFRYVPEGHQMEVKSSEDVRPALFRAGLGQSAIEDAPAVFVVTGVVARTEARYGARAERYVLLEAGHVAENLLLQAVALELGAVPIGAFTDDDVSRVLGLDSGESPLYVIPVGHPCEPPCP